MNRPNRRHPHRHGQICENGKMQGVARVSEVSFAAFEVFRQTDTANCKRSDLLGLLTFTAGGKGQKAFL